MDLVNCVFPKEQVGRDENADSDIIDSEQALKTRANILAWQTMQRENWYNGELLTVTWRKMETGNVSTFNPRSIDLARWPWSFSWSVSSQKKAQKALCSSDRQGCVEQGCMGPRKEGDRGQTQSEHSWQEKEARKKFPPFTWNSIAWAGGYSITWGWEWG